jgi:hypothetical protein
VPSEITFNHHGEQIRTAFSRDTYPRTKHVLVKFIGSFLSLIIAKNMDQYVQAFSRTRKQKLCLYILKK